MKANRIVPGLENFEAAKERLSTTSFSMSSAHSASIEAYHQKLWQPPNRKVLDSDGVVASVNAESLEATLSDPIAIGYLLHFMTRQYCSENLRAWMVIDDYKAEYRANQRPSSSGELNNQKNENNARRIWKQFVGDDAVFEICVRDDERKKVETILESRGAEKAIFDFAQDHAMETIRKDTWPRYLRSCEYKDYCTGSLSYEKGLTEILLQLPEESTGPWTLRQLQNYCRSRRSKPESIFRDRTLFNLLRDFDQHVDGQDHCAEGVCLFFLAVKQFDELATKSSTSDETKNFCWFVYFSFLAPGGLFEVPTDQVVLKNVCMHFANIKAGLFNSIREGCQPHLLKCWERLCACNDPRTWRSIFESALPAPAARSPWAILPCGDRSPRRNQGNVIRVPLLEKPNALNAEVQTFVHQGGRRVYNLDLERVTAVMLVAGANRMKPRTLDDLKQICKRVDAGFDRVPPAGHCASQHLERLRKQITNSRLKIESMMHFNEGGLPYVAADGFGSFTGGSFASSAITAAGKGKANPLIRWSSVWQFYTRMASQCLGLIIGRALAITSTEKSAEIVPYLVFVQYKERVGMEWALVAGILSSAEFLSRHHMVLTSLINLQNFLRDTFKSHCTPEMLERFNELEESENSKSCDNLRALVLETYLGRASGDESASGEDCCVHAGDWYDWMTKRLSDYHEIERTLCSKMLHQPSQITRRASFTADENGRIARSSSTEQGDSSASMGGVVRAKLRFARASRIERSLSQSPNDSETGESEIESAMAKESEIVAAALAPVVDLAG
jgi:hypothetical protein